jgi:hypothetical protein
VQVVKAASQWPAQATPFGARFRIEVSFELKVTGVARLVPDAVCTVAAKLRVPPTVRESVAEGVRLM